VRIAFVDSVHPLLADRLQAEGHQCEALQHCDDESLAQALAHAEGIVVRSRVLSRETLANATDLKFIGRVGAGLENIDRDHCEARGITVLNSPEGNRDGVGELCVAQTLALLKHTHRANAEVHAGLWSREENRGSDLFGRTVGIIGFGHMGSAFAEKLAGFGVRVLAHDKYKKLRSTEKVHAAGLDDLLAQSDIISLHLPLTPETRHYADASFFHRVQKNILLINSSRGGVLDTKALLDAMDRGKVLGAALDVLEYERADLSGLDPTMDPATQRRLFGHKNILLTPHIAGVTHEGKEKMAAVLAEKILTEFPHGRP
jgi:D-3-phosphoglycerate dehydrogenase